MTVQSDLYPKIPSLGMLAFENAMQNREEQETKKRTSNDMQDVQPKKVQSEKKRGGQLRKKLKVSEQMNKILDAQKNVLEKWEESSRVENISKSKWNSRATLSGSIRKKFTRNDSEKGSLLRQLFVRSILIESNAGCHQHAEEYSQLNKELKSLLG